MIGSLFCSGLLETGTAVRDQVMVVRDGVVNMFVLRGNGGLVCFDMGWRPKAVIRGFAALGLGVEEVTAVFVTHSHWDHAGCKGLYPNAALYAGDLEIPYLRAKTGEASGPWLGVKDDEIVTVAGISVRAIHTPGHTRGSMSYVARGRFLFSGDTIRLRNGEVRPPLFWLNCDNKAIRRSMGKLALVNGLDGLLTGHTGLTCDIAGAFSRWRGVGQGFSRKDECLS